MMGGGGPKRPLELPHRRFCSGQPWRRPGSQPVSPTHAQNPARTPTPGCTYPSPKAPDPHLGTKRRRNYVTDAPTNSHPNPPALLGIRRFLHLCAEVPAVLPPPCCEPSPRALGPRLPPRFCATIGWEDEGDGRLQPI